MRAPKTTFTSLLAGTALAIAAFATPAAAAPGATIDGIDRDGCDLTINVTNEDAGTYYVVIYDDSVLLESIQFTPAAGATTAIPYTIVSNVSAGSPGLGVYVSSDAEAEDTYDAVDPYDFENSGDITQVCADQATSTTSTSTTTSTTTTTTQPAPVTTAPPAVQGTAGAPAATPISGTAAYTG